MDQHRSPLRAAALQWVARPRQLELPPGPPASARPWATRGPTSVLVRGGRAQDADAVGAMHDRCSMDTIFRRYLCAAPALSRAWQVSLLETTVSLVAVDPRGAVHALGTVTADDGDDRDDPAGPSSAEMAVLVEDAYQGRGLGTAMARHLAAAARLGGFRSLRMHLLPSSAAAARTAARLGPAAAVSGPGVVTLTLRLRVETLAGLGVA